MQIISYILNLQNKNVQILKTTMDVQSNQNFSDDFVHRDLKDSVWISRCSTVYQNGNIYSFSVMNRLIIPSSYEVMIIYLIFTHLYLHFTVLKVSWN